MIVLVLIVVSTLVVACGQDAASENEGTSSGDSDTSLKIGLSVVDLTLERWQHDRDIFIERAEELGAEVIVQSADGDADKQLSQIENMLSQNVDVLVIIAANSDALAPIVEQAKDQGVIVVAHDRLINNAEIDAYVSFDNEGVGEMQAQYLIDRVPQGKYFLLGGEPSDHTAHMFRQGQMNILQPLIDSGDIEVIGDQWADGYSGEQALSIIENALTANNNDIDAIVAPNDSTAGGAIQALEGQSLIGEILVTGQDADLAAVQRIAEGKQSMTVYKPIKEIATTSAEVAVRLAEGEELEADVTIDNGIKEVPFVQLTPISVDKDNLLEVIVEDEFHSYEDVYKNVPEDERPAKP
ncbi:D-xylose ABC transporter substrate-binding protein [Oceanobacillus alkalisoli]|uniref:D-xylose ABC transporter substrate-binding protein n=1 Tax=Oceanobacillus alkalisoli TaxID=2925113 RepID=UPI001F11A353|nr:D-xylose ABC transporter substrate-binding protein [Oceanobacillus alkalisoli]MCF3942799.1 D-xylose ABC transporter substrate-binding protein [Oceanobacillus alkalisoli]